MKTTVFLLILLFSTTYCQNKQLSREDTWNISESFELQKNLRTNISLYDQDSLTAYCLFDNIVEKDASLRFVLSDRYFEEKENYNDDIILPLPPLENRLYFIKYSNANKTVIKKFLYMK